MNRLAAAAWPLSQMSRFSRQRESMARSVRKIVTLAMFVRSMPWAVSTASRLARTCSTCVTGSGLIVPSRWTPTWPEMCSTRVAPSTSAACA